MHQKKENILLCAKATTYTFTGADFKTFKYDDFYVENDEFMTYQVHSSIHVPNFKNISKSSTTFLKRKRG
jgi:hypothetical protein